MPVFEYRGLNAAGKSHGLYGTGLQPSNDWQYVTFNIPASATFPVRWNSFQAINTDVTQQVAGEITFGGVEADVPSEVDLPGQEPLRSDSQPSGPQLDMRTDKGLPEPGMAGV